MRNIDKKFHMLYKTTNLLNEKYYYGIHSTNNIEDGYLGSGKRLRYSIRKYGKENFKREILQMFDNREALIQAEIDILTRDILEDVQCMNINFGGDSGSLGRVNVKDQNGNTFSVSVNDPRYLSGELLFVMHNRVLVKNDNNVLLSIFKDDPRYTSGELKSIMTGYISVKDQFGNHYLVLQDDPRYLSGEFVFISTGMVTVKDNFGNVFQVAQDDPRYTTREVTGIWAGRQHKEETKNKMSEKAKLRTGEKNSSFGTCWITRNNENKKIKNEELELFILQGWSKGRKIKYTEE